jgi:hypothetical protein
MTCTMQTWLGAYVLDALEPEETETVRQHLGGCAECWDEVARLSWIPPLLQSVGLTDVEEADAVPEAPPVMLDRLLSSVHTVRRFPRRRAVLLAAAAIVIGALTAGGIGAFGNDHASNPIAVSTVAPHSRVSAAVTMSARTWGTELHLKLSWVKPGQECSLIARSRDGRSDVAATWIASYKGTASVPGATAIPLSQLKQLDVMTADGHLLVRIFVPPHVN